MTKGCHKSAGGAGASDRWLSVSPHPRSTTDVVTQTGRRVHRVSRPGGVAPGTGEQLQAAARADAEVGEPALGHLDRCDVRSARRVAGAVIRWAGEAGLHVRRR